MNGKSLSKLERYSESVPHFSRLIDSFPQSKYLDDAFYGRSVSRFRLEQHKQAAEDLLWLSDFSNEKKLLRKAIPLFQYILRNKLSVPDLRSLQSKAETENSEALITTAIARQELASGAEQSAFEVLTRYKQQFGSNAYSGEIDQLIREARTASNRPPAIGVVLPLSGIFGEEGKGVLRGIRFAHAENNSNGTAKLDLVVRDSESNMVKAIQATQELIDRHRVKAIIGELESAITAGIGALAAEQDVVLVGPTATENGVASLGETIFQLNSDLERKGRAIAVYAIQELGMQTFATMAPADDYGQQMIASFSSTVDELGGRIIAQSWYNGTPEDVSRQFKNIREAAFQYDSTDVETMIKEAEERGEDLRERDIPVLSIDAVFMPIYSEDTQYIGPQLAQQNIRTQILGGEYLDNIQVLTKQQVQPYVEGVIFVSDYFPDENDTDFRQFRTNFRLQMKKTPERWEVFGYDAYKLIVEAIRSGNGSSVDVRNHLAGLLDYKGKKGQISFRNSSRVNEKVNFLQFSRNRIVKHKVVSEEN